MRLLRRDPRSHKGTYGHIFILAGSARYSGAALLCAEGALRTGAGLVTIGIPKSINTALIRRKAKEIMTLPLPETVGGSLSGRAFGVIKDFMRRCDVVVIGPGLGREKATQLLIRRLVRSLDRAAVIDADGLNALAGNPRLISDRGVDIVMTPHPAEMSRLTGQKTDFIQANRKRAASECARKHGAVLVLKGHRTVVADKSGKSYVNTTGNPGMATGGTGDVLSGMIAALLGQGLAAFEAAKYAVYLHGLAGDLAAREKTQPGMIASDVIEKIPEALKISRRSKA